MLACRSTKLTPKSTILLPFLSFRLVRNPSITPSFPVNLRGMKGGYPTSGNDKMKKIFEKSESHFQDKSFYMIYNFRLFTEKKTIIEITSMSATKINIKLGERS